MNISVTNDENELIAFLNEVAPEQSQFITGDFFKHGPNIAFAARNEEGNIIGCIRYCIQIIGTEPKCPPIFSDGTKLKEAKINAFAVASEHRNNGIGKELQKKVIQSAKENRCYQLASYSTYDKVENYAIKIKLGFTVQPETQPDGLKGSYFLKKL